MGLEPASVPTVVPSKDVPAKAVTFVIVTFLLSAPLYYLILKAGLAHAYSSWLMWAPGLAALMTQLIHERSLGGLGWAIARPGFFASAYLLPLAYVTVVYGFVWTTGLGSFDPTGFLAAMGGVLPFKLDSPAAQTAAGIGFVMTYGVLTTCWATLGEELGWRGLLVPELARSRSFAATALLSGGIWAVWHFPVLWFADYHNPGAPSWYGLLCFTVLVLGISFPFAWFRLKSGSVWVPVLLHAAHNVFIQAVFTPMTRGTDASPYWIDEFGAGLALAGVVVGYAFWRKRAELPLPGPALPPRPATA